MKRPALYEAHAALGAKFAPFAGWEMPLQYASVLSEHRAVRERAGLFDVSHLGNIFVSGGGVGEYLDSVFPGKVAALSAGEAGYNLLLNESAGIVDDLFIYRVASGFMIVPNAANTPSLHAFLRNGAAGEIEVTDESAEWTILALSGPVALQILEEHLPQCRDLRLHRFIAAEALGADVLIARTGYTGEPTFEFFVPAAQSAGIWDLLMRLGNQAGIQPAGLAARDLLRLEMGYPLHGSDIDESTNPLEAGLGWLIDWDKTFTGSEALAAAREAGIARKLSGLVGRGREIPRAGCAVLRGGRKIGAVTSGNFSPVLRTGVALAYLPVDAAAPGTTVEIDVRGRMLVAEVVKPPFIRS